MAGIDLGTAWLNVVPSFKGTARALSSELSSVSGSVLPKDFGVKSTRGFVSNVKSAMAESRTAAASAAQAVQAAMSRVKEAQKAQASAAAQTEIANKKLAETIKKYGEDSSQAAQASLNVKNALAQEKAAATAVKRALEGVGQAQEKAANTQALTRSQAVMKTLGQTARNVGASIKQSFGDAFRTAGLLAGAGLTAAIGFIGSYAGEAIRASDATDKFKSTLNFAGLDSSAISALTKSTKEYADKTVYDLSDIQNITAQLASNGVAGFDKLAEAAGNLNAVAGGNKETFKSVGQVITQTAGAGKLMTENWRQLTDAIPGAAGPLKQALLEAGAYTGDFQKAMENGEITADEFNQAITSLGFQEAAQEAATSTSTFEGAWGNLEAAITGGLQAVMEPFKGPLTSAMTALADKVTSFFDAIASGLNGGGMSQFSGTFSGLLPIIGALAGSLGTLLSQIIPGIGGAFGAVTGPAGLIIGLFASMVTNSTALQQALGTVFDVIGGVFQSLAPVVNQIMGSISGLAQMLGDALAPIISSVALAIGSLIQGVLPAVGPLITAIVSVVSALIPPISQIISIVLATVLPMVRQLTPIIAEVIGVITQVIGAIVPLVSSISAVLIPTVQALMPVVQTVFDAVKNIIESAMTAVQGVINIVLGVINGDWSQVWSGMQGLVTGVFGVISGLITGAMNVARSVISSTLNVITGIWSSAWNALTGWVSKAWSGIASAVSSGVSRMMGFITSIPSRIQGVFASAGSWLLSAGRQIIDGFVRGIRNAFGAVKNVLGSLTSLLPSWKGPADLDKVILRDSGRLVIEGFQRGLEDQYQSVRRSLGGFTASLSASTALSPALASGTGTHGYMSPEYLVVKDADNRLIGRMRVEAGSVVDGATAVASRASLRELVGI